MDFPSNSQNSAPKPTPVQKEKVEKVVQGKVVQRKKPLGKRFTEFFVGGDARDAGSFVVLEVLLPALRNMVADSVQMYTEKALWGEVRSRPRSGGLVGGLLGGNTNYNKVSAPGWRADPRDPRAARRNALEMDEIIVETRVEAEHVLDSMVRLLQKYEQVTVSDVHDLLGTTAAYTDNKWGWVDLRGADIRPVREGYLIKLPQPDSL